MADEAWRRLAGLIRDRRIDQGLSQAQLATEAGTTERTVRLIEKAERESYRQATLRGISRALGWTPDSIERIASGGDPTEAPADDDPELHAKVDELERRLAEAVAELGGALVRLDQLENHLVNSPGVPLSLSRARQSVEASEVTKRQRPRAG